MIGPGAGERKGFYDPYFNYGHYSRLEAEGLSDWRPSFIASGTHAHIKIRQWGNKLIALLKSTATRAQGKSKHHRHCIGQQSLPLNLPTLQQLPEHWQQIAQQFCLCNAPRWNDDDHFDSS